MAYHVEPPFPRNAVWWEVPVFVSTEGFGVVPNYLPIPAETPAPEPEAEPAVPAEPPDLDALRAELAALDKRARDAFWNRTREPAGHRVLSRLTQIVAQLTPLFAAAPGHPRMVPKLLPVPAGTSLLALEDVRRVISNALLVVEHLIARRVEASRRASLGESAHGYSADRPLEKPAATDASQRASTALTATQESRR